MTENGEYERMLKLRLALSVSLLACACVGGGEPLQANGAGATQDDAATQRADGYNAKRPITYGRDLARSPEPSFPQPQYPPKGAPNVIVIMTDDAGFASSSTFGGGIPTPTFDRLAAEGLRFNRFHTTAICSPTRASLLTGRNPQSVGMGYVTNWATGFEGHNSVIPKSAGTLPAILKQAGYSTAMFGKGHITPEWELGPNGPFDRWPTGLGFQYYYGFLGADTSAFEPSLIENTRPVTIPADPDYHLDKDLADRAIHWIAEQRATDPDRPFFIYYAPGTAHAPNHAPAEWLAKFRGKFDNGWDQLRLDTIALQKELGVIPADTQDAPRPDNLPIWNELPAEKRALYARYMEAYAASLAYADFQIGRMLDELDAAGELDNTVVIYIQGDNGASAEGRFDGKLFEQSALSGVSETPEYVHAHASDIGGRHAYNLNPGGWGWAMNAPFPWAKRYASHLGGIRNGMVISWPGHIGEPGGIRDQFIHVSDIMPTVLEIAGVSAPDVLDGVRQQRIDGISALYSFSDAEADDRRNTQLFAMRDHLGIYHNGWFAATTPLRSPWDTKPEADVAIDERQWELYDLTSDFSQSHDVSAQYPKQLKELKELFWNRAADQLILPIHVNNGRSPGMPNPNHGRARFEYRQLTTQLAESVAPDIVGHSFTISADVETTANVAGVLAAHGGRFGGYALYFDQGRPAFTFNLTPAHITRLVAPEPVEAGRHEIGLSFVLDQEKPKSGGTIRLLIDGEEVARARVAQTFPLIVSHSEGFDIGQDPISPVDASYESSSSRFNGHLYRLTFDLAE